MLVADVDASGLHELDREYVITNLGEGVNASGVLKPQAMERVAQAVDDFQRVLARFRTAEHPSIETVAMATSAARDARNAEEFAALLAAHGVTLAVIPGQREAALSVYLLISPAKASWWWDVGGGSTEVVAGRAGADPFMSHSFDIGLPSGDRAVLFRRPADRSGIGAGPCMGACRHGAPSSLRCARRGSCQAVWSRLPVRPQAS